MTTDLSAPDPYGEIRRALEAVQPLEWLAVHCVVLADAGDCEFPAVASCVGEPMADEHAAFIAACNPKAIRALLDELDALRSAASQDRAQVAAPVASPDAKLRSALLRLVQLFPTDTDMDAAGWDLAEINAACDAYDNARAILARGIDSGEAGETLAARPEGQEPGHAVTRPNESGGRQV